MAAPTTTEHRTTENTASALLSLARVMNQFKTHDTFCRQAGVDLDRSGAALLYKLFSEGEDVRLGELAERLGIDSPAVTRKVQQLERAGHGDPVTRSRRRTCLAGAARAGGQAVDREVAARP